MIRLMRRQLFYLMLSVIQLVVALPAVGANSNALQPIPALTSPVIDLTGTLNINQQKQLSQKIRLLHEKYGAQMQVLIVATSAPEDAFTYSMRVVEKWKLGTAEKDNGLLLFIAKDDRRSQIQVGYGLEGTIPDVVASRLLNEVMAPYFKQGEFYGGINAVIDSVYQRISGEIVTNAENNSNNVNSDNQKGSYFLVLIIFGMIIIKILKSAIGDLKASIIGAPMIFFVVWLIIGLSLVAALGIASIILLLAWLPNDIWLALLSTRHGRSGGSGWGGSGGGFGGGGASGRW